MKVKAKMQLNETLANRYKEAVARSIASRYLVRGHFQTTFADLNVTMTLTL